LKYGHDVIIFNVTEKTDKSPFTN